MRRIERLTIEGARAEIPGQRDNGKTFVLTEMDAYSGQDWALRLVLALAASGAQLPDGALQGGMETIARLGLTALLQAPYGALKPLASELLACAKYEHAPGQPLQTIVPGANCAVEEIPTFFRLYKALFVLHTGFLSAGAPPISG